MMFGFSHANNNRLGTINAFQRPMLTVEFIMKQHILNLGKNDK